MPNKKISEFPVTTSLDGSDIFLINHLNSTSTIAFSALSALIATNILSSGGGLGGGGDATPIGTVCWFAASAAPTGYLECNGAAVSVALHPDLTTAIYCGDSKNNTAKFGYRCTNSSSPTTSRSTAGQFIVLPDLRGEFIRGWSNGKAGVDTGRVFGSNQSDDFKSHTHEARGSDLLTGSSNAFWWDSGNSGAATRTTLPTGGSETRPRNVALLPCIKAIKTVTGNTNTLNFIEKPASAANGQILTYNGSTSTWVASAASFENVIGNNQTYQDVTASRSKDTTYTNTTTKPILVCVSGGVTTGPGVTMIYKVNGIIIGDGTGDSTNGGANYPFSFVVPVGSTYRVEGTRNIGRWVELR